MSIDCDVAAFQSGSITVKLQDQLIELPKLLIPTSSMIQKLQNVIKRE